MGAFFLYNNIPLVLIHVIVIVFITSVTTVEVNVTTIRFAVSSSNALTFLSRIIFPLLFIQFPYQLLQEC